MKRGENLLLQYNKDFIKMNSAYDYLRTDLRKEKEFIEDTLHIFMLNGEIYILLESIFPFFILLLVLPTSI